MAVPGSLYDLRHQGTNQLIQAGAHLVTKPEDILDLLGIAPTNGDGQGGAAEDPSSPLEQTLRAHGGSLHLPQLSALLERTVTPEELCLLELAGKIVLLPGDLVRIN
jgi:predicted Rossmann fold nucleotide-binding protein DprA/Smf involved in DNA uptake